MPQSTSDPTSGHPIFQGPLPIELELEEVPTPTKYKYYELTGDVPATMTTVKILKKEWDTLNLPVGGRPDNGEPGVVTTGDGFLDSPDTEWIAGGMHLKGPDYFAIGRQGRLLQWGFYGTPDEMTETGQRLLINAVHYIHGFKDHPVLATREARPREGLATSLALLDIYATEEMKEYYDTPEKVKEAQDRVIERTFGETVPAAARGSKEERRAWYGENEPYVYWDGARVGSEYAGKAYFRLEGKYRTDEDARALGIANNDPALLKRAVADLHEGVEPERAHRLLARYSGAGHDSADDWQSWLDENEGSLFASDWGGYRFPGRQRTRRTGLAQFVPVRSGRRRTGRSLRHRESRGRGDDVDNDRRRVNLGRPRLQARARVLDLRPRFRRGVQVRCAGAVRLRLPGRRRPRPAQGGPGGPDTRRLPDRSPARRLRRRGDDTDRLPGMRRNALPLPGDGCAVDEPGRDLRRFGTR